MRADAGIITTASREIAYAATGNYDITQATGRQVLELMRSIGEAITGEQADTPPLWQEIRRR